MEWIANVFRSLFNKYTGAGLTGAEREAHDLNVAETQRQEQRQEDFYNKYQSIGAQVDQYKKAGLNPALLAGGVSVSSPVSGVSANPASASPSGDPIQAVLSTIDGIRSLKYKKENHEAELANKEADTRLKTANAAGKEFENMNAADLLALDKREREAKISKIFSGIDVDQANIALAKADTNLKEVEARYKEVLTAISQIEEKYRGPILEATQAKINAEAHYTQVQEEIAQCRLALDNENSDAERRLIEARIEVLNEQKTAIEKENAYADRLLEARTKQAEGDATYSQNKTVLGYIGETAKSLGIIAGAVKLFGTSPKNGAAGLASGGMKLGRAIRNASKYNKTHD